MEMQKLEKSVSSKIEMHMPLRRALGITFVLISSIANVVLYAHVRDVAHDRDVYQSSARHAWNQNELLQGMTRSQTSRLEEMRATAGAYRSYGVYHDCVQQNLGIYQMEEVARAYDRHFRSTELSAQCLAESAWYEKHPHGINPAHLNH